MITEGYAHAYDGGTKDMNLEALREIRRAHGTLVQKEKFAPSFLAITFGAAKYFLNLF